MDAVTFSTAICVVGINSEMSATPGLSTTEPWNKVSGVSPPWMDRRRRQHRACERGFGQPVSNKFYHRGWELSPANREGSHRRFTSEAAEARNRGDDGQGLGSGNARVTRAIHLAIRKVATLATPTTLPPVPHATPHKASKTCVHQSSVEPGPESQMASVHSALQQGANGIHVAHLNENGNGLR